MLSPAFSLLTVRSSASLCTTSRHGLQMVWFGLSSVMLRAVSWLGSRPRLRGPRARGRAGELRRGVARRGEANDVIIGPAGPGHHWARHHCWGAARVTATLTLLRYRRHHPHIVWPGTRGHLHVVTIATLSRDSACLGHKIINTPISIL